MGRDRYFHPGDCVLSIVGQLLSDLIDKAERQFGRTRTDNPGLNAFEYGEPLNRQIHAWYEVPGNWDSSDRPEQNKFMWGSAGLVERGLACQICHFTLYQNANFHHLP